MQRIEVRPMGRGEYAAAVTEGQDVTHHRVIVPDGLLDDLGLISPAQETLAGVVRESLAFLLDREPGDAIEPDLDLDSLPGRFPDYLPELRSRLGL
jgi:hypothetical protein